MKKIKRSRENKIRERNVLTVARKGNDSIITERSIIIAK